MADSTDKILSVMMKFSVDPAALSKSVDTFKKIQTEITGLEDEAVKLKDALSKALPGEQADALNSKLKSVEKSIASLRAKADTELGVGVTKAFDKVAESATGAGSAVDKAFNLRDIGEKLQRVGSVLTNAGRSIEGVLNNAISAYMASADATDASAKRWKEIQESQNESMARIGKVALDELAPVAEQVADLLSDFADLIEKNPELVKAIAATGTAMVAGGTLMTTLGQLAMTIGALQGLGTMLGGSATAGALSAAGGAAGTAGAYGAAAIGGGMLGKGLGNAINTNLLGQGEESWSDIAKTAQQLSAILSPMGMFSQALDGLGFDEQAKSLWDFTKAVNGLGDAAEESSQKTEKASTFVKDNLDAYLQFEDAQTKAAAVNAEKIKEINANAEKARVDIINNYEKQVVDLTAKYESDRARSIARFQSSIKQLDTNYASQRIKITQNYHQQEMEAERQYYAQRAALASSHSLEVKRMEEDHQREMRDLLAESKLKLNDLANEGDALGYIREKQSYEQNRQKAEEQYSIEAQRKNEDYARQMADLERNFAEARQQRANDYRKQLEDAAAQYRAQKEQKTKEFLEDQQYKAEQYAEEKKRLAAEKAEKLRLLDESTKEQLKKLGDAYYAQLQMIQTTFVDRLNSMSKSIMGDTTAFENYMKQKSAAFEAFLRSKGYTPGSIPARAYGGYASFGAYLLGDNNAGGPGPDEFVLDGNTTRSLERVLGGRLTQQAVTNIANSRRYNITVPITGVNPGDEASLRRVVYEAVETALLDAISD